MNPLKKLLGQTAIYGLSSIVGRLLNYLLVPLYTRYFTTSEYGDVTLLYAYAAFLLIILSYGIETAFFRFSQREPNKRVVYSTALISLLVSSSLFVALIYFNANTIFSFHKSLFKLSSSESAIHSRGESSFKSQAICILVT